MANQFAKKDIDFDVYERADPASQIDWGKEAKVISDAFTGVAEERQKKKAAIEKSFQDQQTALQDIGEYDNPTIQQFVMNGGQDVSNKLLDVKNLVERGLMKPSDATMWQHNATTGFNLLKKNAQQYDKTFQEYTTRVQDGTGAPGETWMATQLEGFANMNNMSLQADSATGNMVMLRLDEKGEPIPGESMSVQHMSLLMKQKIDNFDSTASLEEIKKSMGTIITADIDPQGIRTDITTEERSRAETEFFATEGGQEFLEIKTQEFLANPPGFNQQSLMVNAGLTTPKGEKYAIGSQEEYDKWNEEYPDDEENNPILRMVFGKDNLYRPEFNDAQDEAARAHASQMITGSLDVKETAKSQHIEKRVQPQPSAASLAGAKEEKEKSSRLGDYEIALNDDDPKKRKDMLDKLFKKRNDQIKESNKGKSDEEKTVLIKDVRIVQKEVDGEVVDVRVVVMENGDEIPLEGNTGDQMNTLDLLLNPDNNLTTDDIKDLAAGREIDLTREVKSKSDKTRTQKGKTTPINFDNPTLVGEDEYATSDAYLKDVFGDVFKADKYSATADTDKGIAKNWAAYVQAYFPAELITQFQEAKQPLTSNYVDEGDQLPGGGTADGDKLVMTLGGRELIIDITNPTTNQKEIEAWMIGIQKEEDDIRTTTGGEGGGNSR